MFKNTTNNKVLSAIESLSECSSFQQIDHKHKDGEPFPSVEILKEIVDITRSILFPGYFGHSTIDVSTIK